MPNLAIQENQSPFELIKRHDAEGNEYWLARELMPLLGYEKWERFADSIDRAKASCKNGGNPIRENFFPEVGKSHGRPKEDYQLTKLACFLIAQNGDPRKPEIAAAQNYFAFMTQLAETVIPAQGDRIRALELENENLKLKVQLAGEQQKLIASGQMLEKIAPGLAGYLLGDPDAVIERVQVVERVIDKSTNRVTEGISISQLTKELGFKNTAQTWRYLESIGYGKDSGCWEPQLYAAEPPSSFPSILPERLRGRGAIAPW